MASTGSLCRTDDVNMGLVNLDPSVREQGIQKPVLLVIDNFGHVVRLITLLQRRDG